MSIQNDQKIWDLFSIGPIVVYTCEAFGDFATTSITPNITKQLGYEPEEFLSTPSFWASNIHPSDSARVFEQLGSLFEKEHHSHEYRFRHKDGSYRWLQDDLRLIKSEGGRPQSIVGYWTDITAKKQAEEQLSQFQKMEIVGQLAGGVAHDFNNLLSIMIGNADLLKRKFKSDEKAERYINAILKAGHRGASLTQRLLAFSRKQALSSQPTVIRDLVFSLEDMLRRTLGETIELSTHFGSEPCEAYIDPHQLENALINLAINARDAMPNGGVLTIEAANVTLDDAYVEQYVEVAPGDYVKITVSDTGSGIAPEILENVFEPFFTTKDVGKGSGLGLSMVFGFVKQSNGDITVHSKEGHGTTFELYMPRSKDAPTKEDIPDEVPEFALGSEHILVVEDDEFLRDIATMILREQGYQIAEAGNGEEAIQALKGSQAYDLLFTDMVLPGGMNGAEIAKEAKRIQPNIKVIYATGYSDASIVHDSTLVPGVTLAKKPYDRADLLKMVRVMLNSEDD